MKNPFSLLVFLLLSPALFSQEVIFPLGSNPALAGHRSNGNAYRMAAADTVDLPFIDDFSNFSIYPDSLLWTDRDVFINNNYSANPVSIGIATFDGINEFGQPYHPGSNFDSVADYLTSRPIHLDANFQNVWLNFYYQPQGLGDIPEPGDSLVLQFKDTASNWENVWGVPGKGDTAFKRISINITDPKFLYHGFQFRFYNIATTNGNRDHWNLDYLILKNNSVANDSINDFCFIHPQHTLLQEFTSMPYSHYKVNGIPAAQMATSLQDTLRNFDYGAPSGSSVQPFLRISDSIGLSNIYGPTSLIVGLNVQSDTGFNVPLNSFQFPTYGIDSVRFLVQSYSDSPVNQYKQNDSSYFYQNFYNYYSYDDGSAEVAYGLTGNSNVWAAYQFDVKMQDTLRGVQIYFNPTGINVTNKLFQLTVWSDVNVGANTSVEMYRMINQRPDTFDGINVFKTYLFDSVLTVGPGNIWVGMIQNEPQTLYGIGFDRNTDSRSHMFYHIDGFWYQSQLQGSWMMRPLFGRDISLVSVVESNESGPQFSIHPNPVSSVLHLKAEGNTNYHYQIYDRIGSIVSQGSFYQSKSIDLGNFARGIYFLRLSDEAGKSSVQKFIRE